MMRDNVLVVLIVTGFMVVLVAAFVGLPFASRAVSRWRNEVSAAPCASTVVDGTRCVYCTGHEAVAVSCDWSKESR